MSYAGQLQRIVNQYEEAQSKPAKKTPARKAARAKETASA